LHPIREILFYRDYFNRFYSVQTKETKEKIDFVLFMIVHLERVPEKFLKHLTGYKGLYEIRIEIAGNNYRIFCCFDKLNIVVLLNGFQKKTQKTPKKELELASKLKVEYFLNRNQWQSLKKK
jgi:phage-related protein